MPCNVIFLDKLNAHELEVTWNNIPELIKDFFCSLYQCVLEEDSLWLHSLSAVVFHFGWITGAQNDRLTRSRLPYSGFHDTCYKVFLGNTWTVEVWTLGVITDKYTIPSQDRI